MFLFTYSPIHNFRRSFCSDYVYFFKKEIYKLIENLKQNYYLIKKIDNNKGKIK